MKSRSLALFAAFWLLAAAITWTAYLFRTPQPDAETFRAIATNHPLLIAKFGPSIAGVLLLAVSGRQIRAQFRAALFAVNRPALLVTALFVPALITAASLAVAALSNGQNWHLLPSLFALQTAASWVALRIFVGGGLGEELGIRGLALPLLLKTTGPRFAALVIGLLWAAWHLPVLWGKSPLIWIGQTALTISTSIILTYVWVRFAPSILVAAVFHGTLNGWAAYASDWVPDIANQPLWQILRLSLLLLIAAALLPLSWQRAERPGHGT